MTNLLVSLATALQFEDEGPTKQQIRFGHYDQTTVHPVGLGALGFASILTVLLPRTWMLLPFMLLGALIPTAQRIVIAGIDFNFLRILVIVGLLRIVVRGEASRMGWSRLDTMVLLFGLAETFVFTIRSGSFTALTNRLGVNVDTIGAYFIARAAIREPADVRRFAIAVACAAIPVGISLMIEKLTARNAFAVFGGIPPITQLREGKLRAQGAFSHPILTGTFWAVLIPFVGALWFTSKGPLRLFALAACLACVACVFACASSTPLAVLLAVGMGGALWRWRESLPAIRNFTLGVLALYCLCAWRPPWRLMASIDFVGGSTGYHRYLLMSNFAMRVHEWFFLGLNTTAHWGFGQQDITNQYVLHGVRGGMLTLVLFFAVIVLSFRGMGSIRRAVRGRPEEFWVWAIGLALCANLCAFLAVSYFGQSFLAWWLVVGIAGSIQGWARRTGILGGRPAGRTRAVSSGSGFRPSAAAIAMPGGRR